MHKLNLMKLKHGLEVIISCFMPSDQETDVVYSTAPWICMGLKHHINLTYITSICTQHSAAHSVIASCFKCCQLSD